MKKLVLLILILVMTSGCTQLMTQYYARTQQETLEWCVPGETWTMMSQPVGIVTGATTYKGQTRCHITKTTEVDGGPVVTNFYILDEEGNDLWIDMTHPNIVAIAGKSTVEAHMVDMQCTEGDCEYFEASVISSATPSRSS